MKERDIRELLPVREYDPCLGCFRYADGRLMDMVQIRAKDLTSGNTEEIRMDCIKWAKFHRMNLSDVKLIFLRFPCNTSTQQAYWERKIQRNRNPVYEPMLYKKQEELVFRERHISSQEFYLMFFGADEEELKDNWRQIETVLQTGYQGLVLRLPEEKKVQILYKLANKNSLIFQKRETKKEHEGVPKGPEEGTLLRTIAPAGDLISKEAYIRTGTGYEACVHIHAFPTGLNDYWMEKFTRFDQTITTIDLHTEDITEVKRNLNKAIDEQATRKNMAANFSEYYNAEKRAAEMQRLFDDIDTLGEVVKTVQIRIYTSSMTFEGLEKNVEEIIRKLEADSFRAAVFLNEQLSEWKSMYLPAVEQTKVPHAIKGNPLESELLSMGNPFHFSALEDSYGAFLGYTPCGGNLIYDAFYRSNSRVNYSAVITGRQRFGKSTLLKLQLKERTIRGDFTRTFDITGEFSALTKQLGGRVLSMDGSAGIINLLEIFDAGSNDHTNYSQHWAKLKTCYLFLKSDTTSEELDIFHEMTELLYQKYDLLPAKGKTITGLAAKRYPTFSDLYRLIQDQMQMLIQGEYSEVEQHLAEHKLLHLNNVKNQIQRLINTYGYLFDGHTSVDNMTDVQTVTYDLTRLKNEDAAIFDLQIYNILSMCWAGLVINGGIMKEKWESGEIALQDVVHFLILIDESHRWVNAQKLFALQFLSTYMRECPKYFGAIWLASQSIRDFTPEAASESGVETLKTIFELTQYKFIFNQDANVLPILDKVFNNTLTYAQRERIPQLQRGETILCISGEENIEFKVYLDHEDERLFSGGA